MSNGPKKITELPIATTLSNNDLFVIVGNTASTPTNWAVTANTLLTGVNKLTANNANNLGGLPAGSYQTVAGLANVATNIIPASNSVYNLGNSTNQWKSLYVSNSTIYIANTPLTVHANGSLLVNNSPVSGGASNIDVVTISTAGIFYANNTNEIILCDQNINVVLPDDATKGKIYTVKNINAGSNAVYIQTGGTTSIENEGGSVGTGVYATIPSKGKSYTWVFDGSTYRLISSYTPT
jgi:hypothetical protein